MTPTPRKNTSEKNTNGVNSTSNGFQVGGQTPAIDESSSARKLVRLSEPQETTSTFQTHSLIRQRRQVPWWDFANLRFASLRTKATILALAIGTVPVVLVGATAYFAANQGIRTQIVQNEETNAGDLEDKLNIFLRQVYENTISMSRLDILTNSKLGDSFTTEEKNATLKRYVETFPIYENIAVFDLKGNLIYTSKDDVATDANGVDWFEAVLKTDRPVIVDPRPALNNNVFSTFIAAPVKDQETDKTIAILRTRVLMSVINDVFRFDPLRRQEFYITDSQGQITTSSQQEALRKPVEELFPKVSSQIKQNGQQSLTEIETENGEQQIFTYLPNAELSKAYNVNWGLLLSRPTEVAFAPQRQLLLTLLVGTAIFALLVAVIAAIVANRATRPIIDATGAVEKIGKGELDTRLEVQGEDELALLGTNINQMAGQITTLLEEQALAAEEQRRLKEEQRQLTETLQNRILELLEEVEPINDGDLTIRARVTADDVGTIADSYNVMVGNLRQIVTKVQAAASNVAETTRSSEESVQALSVEALHQAEEIGVTLKQVQEMAESVRVVAANAEKAAAVVQRANQTVVEGDAAMNRTVDGILAIRETVAQTRQKVKYLGESSQKISTVVNLISSFAAQTKLLAFNASIEAARAGEEGRGFAIVADEVRTLAQQSAEASTEIEKLVAAIQGETNEVITAMESGTEQVVMGTKLIEETRQSLNKITEASAEINQLVTAITQATIEQSATSETVTKTMANVANIASQTSREASIVSSSFGELRTVAQALQDDVGQFKVI
ncbi:methyl-accepting chemotaxis protein [Lyngbya aestuarii]|uniref:methyl-accepting chemotaxis protein n=1 Tax=Lyngbya aestuarii TaxID=118322 RepID=UPI00403D740B